jgi:hypothetical protein
MEAVIEGAFAANVAESRYLVGQHMCPICKRNTGDAMDPHRTLKQHIRRGVDPHHKLWYHNYWRAVFNKPGTKFAPRVKNIEEVERFISKCYGEPILMRIKASPQIAT